MVQTPHQAAQALYAALPHALPRATLEEYGIEATTEQAQQITREVLSLSLFWIRCALDATLMPKHREQVLSELRRCILAGWQSELGLDGADAEGYFEEAQERRKLYDQVMQEGASPVVIATETAAILVADAVVPPEDRPKILALLIDLVPVDQFGELAEQIKLVD